MLFRAFAFVIAVVAAMTLSQVPEFAQQYRQRLGGAVDELASIITHFDEDAARSGYDRGKALAVMARNDEPLVRDQAQRMAETVARHDRLVAQAQAFAERGPFGRLVAFFAEFDPPLVQSTLHDYEPAVPTTVEGVAFTGGGFVFIYLLLHGFRLGYRGMKHAAARRRRRRAVTAE
jgi:hypothetical protein